jgi:hypothetical protein
MENTQVKQSCTHWKGRCEYVETKHGQEKWRCLDCGEVLDEAIDVGSGG